MKEPFEMITEFHETFSPRSVTVPTALKPEQAGFRAEFKVEELVELLYSSANNDLELFQKLVADLKASIDQAQEKVLKKEKPVIDPLVEEVDALTDLLYFTYGSFYLMGVDPTKIFEIVHQANMGKLFPDGKPHYHPVTNKVLKPENWERDCAPEAKIKAEINRQALEMAKSETTK
jgi:predicted HAD superfamily Cof-like phosphohydrolase